jgi:hypothetical protein
MAELAWPTQRPNPLKSFTLYDGRFNAFDINYIAVRARMQRGLRFSARRMRPVARRDAQLHAAGAQLRS